MYTGVRRIDGTLYYFQSSGRRGTSEGWKTWNGNRYYVYSSGRVAVNTTIGNYKIGSDGIARQTDSMNAKADSYASNTNYLVLINTSTHKIGVYKGSVGNWTRKTYDSCADGASDSPTSRGTFTVGSKKDSENAGNYTYWNVVYFGGSAICSVPCYAGTRNVANGTLGRAVSNNGDVRVSMDTAEYIYDVVPSGTKVVVY
jgi:lipoprotein-anchoring transpeptidase ErfK/SrfK